MTRGTNFLNKSKCKCGVQDKTDRPFGHITGSGGMYLKGYCHRCKKIKSLPYTPQHLELEREGIKKFFKNVYKKVLKPAGSHVGKNIIKNPLRAVQVVSQLGAAAATKNPKAIMNAGAQAAKFSATGKGISGGQLVTLTDQYGGSGMYLRVG